MMVINTGGLALDNGTSVLGLETHQVPGLSYPQKESSETLQRCPGQDPLHSGPETRPPGLLSGL